MGFKVQEGPKIDVFMIDRKGLCVPMDVFVSQLEKKRELYQKKLDLIKEREKVLEKMNQNNKHEFVRLVLFSFLMIASTGALLTSSQRAKKVGSVVFWSTVISNAVATVVLDKREKKLKKQDAYLLKKERELGRV